MTRCKEFSRKIGAVPEPGGGKRGRRAGRKERGKRRDVKFGNSEPYYCWKKKRKNCAEVVFGSVCLNNQTLFTN